LHGALGSDFHRFLLGGFPWENLFAILLELFADSDRYKIVIIAGVPGLA
jgi:hypothetical protein